jgi:archaellum component FlaF (FlaF/FlaG flagellin family)
MNLLKYPFLLAMVFSFSVGFSQELLYEVSMQEQIENADIIIEGKVVSKVSYWNSQQTNIFTINTVEVYKIFKGNSASQIEIITPGGTIGLTAEMVIP